MQQVGNPRIGELQLRQLHSCTSYSLHQKVSHPLRHQLLSHTLNQHSQPGGTSQCRMHKEWIIRCLETHALHASEDGVEAAAAAAAAASIQRRVFILVFIFQRRRRGAGAAAANAAAK